MKSTPDPNPSNKLKQNDAFAIPDALWPDQSLVAEILSSIVADKPLVQPARVATYNEAKTDYFKLIVSVATNAWQARKEIQVAQTGEIPDAMKRIERQIDAIYNNLTEFGIVIRDHTGEVYDDGQPMKVVVSKPTPGLDRKRIIETLLPSILWNDRLIQNGEVEIATPLVSSASAEPQVSRL